MVPRWNRATADETMWRLTVVWSEMPTLAVTFDCAAWRLINGRLDIETYPNDEARIIPTSTPLFLRAQHLHQRTLSHV